MESDNDSVDTNWTICAICQEDKPWPLIDPMKNPVTSKQYDGYETLGNTLQYLYENDALPDNIDIRRLDDGYGITETLITHKAKYHNK